MMSKPISISFGKPKVNPNIPTVASAPTLPSGRTRFAGDPEDDVEDGAPSVHEPVLAFASDGVILGQPVHEKGERIIENRGNADWRTRGRPPKSACQLPNAHKDRVETGTVEREEANKKAGLQFAQSTDCAAATTTTPQGHPQNGALDPLQQDQAFGEEAEQTADQAALSALLNGNSNKSLSAIIEQSPSQSYANTGGETLDFRHDLNGNSNKSLSAIIEQSPSQSYANTGGETLDFRHDVASRPDPATLDEYAAMPVEEFGMALVRGMGKKRRANGEVITIKNPNEPSHDEEKTKRAEKGVGRGVGTGAGRGRDPNMGYLGIGAKAAKSVVVGNTAGGEAGLGAWGKADMKKNTKGEGMYTPVMLRDRRTGELISERELDERRRAAKNSHRKRERRDEDEQRSRWRRNQQGGKNSANSNQNNNNRRHSQDRDGSRSHNLKDGIESDQIDHPYNYRDKINGFSRMMIEDHAGSGSSIRSRSREKTSSRRHHHHHRHSSASGAPRSRSRERYSSRRADRDRDRDRDRDTDRRRDRYRGS